jgi:hypothetical protein
LIDKKSAKIEIGNVYFIIHMYEKLNITENHLRVLSLFTAGFEREYYIREVQKLLKISPRTAQLALAYLENSNVLESKLKGKIRAYRLKKAILRRAISSLPRAIKKYFSWKTIS